MVQKLVIFADPREAAATIRTLRAVPTEANVYRFDEGIIAVSGWGAHAAQMTVANHGAAVDAVWNFGLAGALTDHHPIGTLLPIKTVGKYSVNQTPPPLSIAAEGNALITSDFPIHDHTHRARLGEAWELVDMEGYGIAYAATHLKIPCYMYKIVSDFASPGGRELIQKNINSLSEQIADAVHKLF